MQKVCVVGLGYIGLPTASIIATKGCQVIGVDTSEFVVKTVGSGGVHIVEPDLETLVKAAVLSGNLTTRTTPTPADVFIIAVPTPIKADKTADLSFVESAVRSIVPVVGKGNLVVVESTIPPGTIEGVVAPILAESGLEIGADLFVAHCPERVLPGRILEELVQNDRVIGGINHESALVARNFYKIFVHGSILMTSARVAEMVKLVENAYRDVNIAFANELSLICEHLGINVWDVIDLANRHPRVNVLRPGPGVGGHCIAVDPWFIIEKAPAQAKLLKAAREVNDLMPEHVVERIASEMANLGVEKPVVASFGLTYKADVDDTRESPAKTVVEQLLKKGFTVRVCDPYVPGFNGLRCCSIAEAVQGADCLALLVDHKEFKEIDMLELTERMRNKVVIDTRGVWDGA